MGYVQQLTLTLPPWVAESAPIGEFFVSVRDRMALAVGLAAENVRRGTGGPFGACVVESNSGQLIAAGVNLVVPTRCSLAHAEMMALSLAQQQLRTHDLSSAGGHFDLITSAEPCAMCLGAIPWSGVKRVVCGARRQDVEAVGFDEGAKPPDWVDQLGGRGIAVLRDVFREEAALVLRNYAEAGGAIYNAG